MIKWKNEWIPLLMYPPNQAQWQMEASPNTLCIYKNLCTCVFVRERSVGQETESEASTHPSGAKNIERKIQKHSTDSRVKVWPVQGASSEVQSRSFEQKTFLTGNIRLNMQRNQVICSELNFCPDSKLQHFDIDNHWLQWLNAAFYSS